MHQIAVAASALSLDYWTYAVAIIAGLGSGIAAAYVTGRSNRTLALWKRRDEASRALWAYHRTLVGVANMSYSDAGIDWDWGTIAVTKATLEDVRTAQYRAHEYATFLPKDKQHLVRDATIDQADERVGQPEAELTFAESAQKLAHELEEVLLKAFGEEETSRQRRQRRRQRDA
ncbi:hypothetical protein EDF31_101534 [Curtobacterium sp. PhB142]|uniref:hypothetical protein n=1 Tax=unclassified Curtobacterium TaxID=257496 RepID=UPI000DAA506B|nr:MULTISPECIES: hypothetical protein [unclassified Curtobacterium]PZE89843.1 hypothetical protein DEJ00_10945 [Curtobacterium sp. MCLR17_039]TCL88687.1 hypothetical protein EDF31_101534 [Curtobacterium sp. PhB142]TCM03950.1 hypothetical protein EDF26_102160 [Curtobacterium sp. PhB134]